MQAVILAGGKSSRLGFPKALARIAGKTMIEWVVGLLSEFHEIIVVASPSIFLRIKYTLGNDDRVKLIVQPRPLGTANALSYAAPFIKDNFVLMACDTYFLPVSLAMLIRLQFPTLAVSKVQDGKKPGAILRDNQIIEKPDKWTADDKESLMLYGLTPGVLGYLSLVGLSLRGEYEIQEAINLYLADKGQASVLEINEYYHLTTQDDLDELQRIFANTY